MDAEKMMKITYHGGKPKSGACINFTGSTLDELMDVVEKNYDGPRCGINDREIDYFILHWFDDDGRKITIRFDDCVNKFMERTSGLKIRQLHADLITDEKYE